MKNFGFMRSSLSTIVRQRTCNVNWNAQTLSSWRITSSASLRSIPLSSVVRCTSSCSEKILQISRTRRQSSPLRPFTSKDTPPDEEDEVIKELFASEVPETEAPEPEEICVVEEMMRREVAADLFHQYAKVRDGIASLDVTDVGLLLREIGEEPTTSSLQTLFSVADQDNNGVIDLMEFLEHYDFILGGNPARIILVVGGPGSGKGVLSKRLQEECGVVHLSSGDLLRTEVARGSALGRQVKGIMARGELVSSAIMVALMKRRMRDHPGKRVLLDGFPRSLENAHDLVALCGKPELALHLVSYNSMLHAQLVLQF